jgi:hypothetical protein
MDQARCVSFWPRALARCGRGTAARSCRAANAEFPQQGGEDGLAVIRPRRKMNDAWVGFTGGFPAAKLASKKADFEAFAVNGMSLYPLQLCAAPASAFRTIDCSNSLTHDHAPTVLTTLDCSNRQLPYNSRFITGRFPWVHLVDSFGRCHLGARPRVPSCLQFRQRLNARGTSGRSAPATVSAGIPTAYVRRFRSEPLPAFQEPDASPRAPSTTLR